MTDRLPKPPRHRTVQGKRALEILADELAKNYFNTSLPSDDAVAKRKIAGYVCARRHPRVGAMPRGRNILVVGAGASVAAFGPAECPATDKATEIIREKLFAVLVKKHGDISREFIETRLEQEHARLASIYGNAQNDFETQLAVLSSVYSLEDIRSVLVEIYGNRRWPHINFEIIAHLLKHRFVDAVINFNFDELLDQAITEEIGLAQFDYVISDGHCRKLDELMVGGRLKAPLYIKPHGTISHPSTLRFTKQDYLQLPEAMRAFMDRIVRGYSAEEEVEPRYRTNVISIGFAMQSLEFLQILRSAGKSDAELQPDHGFAEGTPRRTGGALRREDRSDYDRITLFHINTHAFRGELRRMWELTGIRNQHFIDVSEKGLDGVLLELWGKVERRFTELYRPRGLARHKIVHSLFNSTSGEPPHTSHRVPPAPSTTGKPAPIGGDESKPPEEVYYTARLCTEIVIALAKGNGRIDLTAAADGRLGEYYERLSLLQKERNRDFSLQDICELFGERRFEMDGYAGNVLVASHRWAVADPAHASLDFATWLYDALQEALASLREAALIAQADTGRTDNIGHLAELIRSDVQAISPDFRHRRLLLFRKPEPEDIIHTNLGLTIRFVEMADTLKWDLMLAISNHGKVMEKYRDHAKQVPKLSEKWFSVLVAKTAHDKITDERLARRGFKRRMLGLTRERPFFRGDLSRQDHHMIVFLQRQEQKGEWRVMGGIQFDKPSWQRQMNPIVIEAPRNGDGQRAEFDLIRLQNCFFGYVDAAIRQEERERAEAHSASEPPPSATIEVEADSDSELARAEKRAKILLDGWWDEIDARARATRLRAIRRLRERRD